MALIPIGAHSLKHSGWPGEQGWGMKQTRLLALGPALSVYEPAGAESKAGLPGAPENSVLLLCGLGF